jgi:hypothetical protein
MSIEKIIEIRNSRENPADPIVIICDYLIERDIDAELQADLELETNGDKS